MLWGKHRLAPSRLALWAGGLATVSLLGWNALSSLYMMWAFATPLPIGDQWDSAYFPDDFARHLFALHNEHRPALGRLVGLADWYLAQGRNGVNVAFIALCFPVFALANYRLVRMAGANRGRALLIIALAMAIQVSAAQHENLLWGFQTAFVASSAFGVLALSLAASIARAEGLSRRAVGLYLLCLVSSLISVFSLASGLLTLIGVAVLLFASGAPRAFKFSYPVFGLAVLAFYLHGYSTPGDHSNPLSTISHPLPVIHYALTYLGAPFSKGGATGAASVIGGFGALLLFVLGADALRLTSRGFELWRSRAGTAYAALFILACMVVGTALMSGLGRIVFGLDQAMSSRYATPVLAFWADIVMLCVIRIHLNAGRSAAAIRLFGILLGMGLALFLAGRQIAFLATAHRVQAERMSSAMAFLLGVRGLPALSLYPVPDRVAQGALDARFDELAAQKKSIFYSGWPQHLGAPLRSWVGDARGRCRGVVDSRTALSGERKATMQLSGWAWLDDEKRPPALIVFANDAGVIVGFGAPGYSRKDLVRTRHIGQARYADFVGYALGGPQSKLQAYAVTLSGASAKACAFGVSGG